MNNSFVKDIGNIILPQSVQSIQGFHYDTSKNSICATDWNNVVRRYNLTTGLVSQISMNPMLAANDYNFQNPPRLAYRGFVYYYDSSYNTNYGIVIDYRTPNRIILVNTDIGSNNINCALSFPVDNNYIVSSIFIKNNTLYVVAVKKNAGVYPAYIGSGIYIFSATFTSLATGSNISLTQEAVLAGRAFDTSTTTAYDSGQCTFDNNNNMYITTFDNGIHVCNMTTKIVTQIVTYNSNKVYTTIAYNSSNNSLFVSDCYNARNTALTVDKFKIDVYSVNGTPLAVPWLAVSNGFTGKFPPNGINISYFCGAEMVSIGFDNNNNFYFVNYGSGSLANGIYVVQKVVCFKEDTQILTYHGYKLIQDLQKGDLVKTSQNGYKPIYKIGYAEITHPCSEERIKDQLYKCSTENFPEVFEDLVLTGCHCILVDSFKDEKEREEAKKINKVNANNDDDDFITENKYRLPACVDKRTTVYEVTGEHTIYHFALENDDYYMNYGVYANGLLVESTSKRFMDQKNMNEITPPPFNRFWDIINYQIFYIYKIFETINP